MANINNFKLLNTKCMKYFYFLEKELNVDLSKEKDKQRFGFYLLMLETILNIKDINQIVDIITDQEFNSVVFNEKYNDYGIDAIYIDEEDNYIDFFNFKFRDKFNIDKKQSINETFLSTKLINKIITKDLKGLKGKIKNISEQVVNKLNSNDIWKLRLYVITNESKELDVESSEIKALRDFYDLETIPIGLDKISEFLSIYPQPVDSILHIDKNSVLPFSETSLSSAKSYIIRVSASDLIRITCDNEEYRNDYKMESFEPLALTKMNHDLLFENVRGFIVKSKFNKNILETLKAEPSKFFMYNNGLTITAADIISEDTNANKKVKITIKDFQVVNGGQSLRTIHKFNQLDKQNIKTHLSECQILLRVFKTSKENNFRNKIAQYTNSQNVISNIDLRALNEEQLQIEQFLADKNIIYARKIGDTGVIDNVNYTHKISMEKFGQILFSIQGYPEKVSNQKKQIFGKYYDQTFKGKEFKIEKSDEYIKKYYKIKNCYEKIDDVKVTDQKIFYILYIDSIMDGNIDEKIKFFERVLNGYKKDEDLPFSRKLIQSNFKKLLDEGIQKV